jgi:hypothetical protein
MADETGILAHLADERAAILRGDFDALAKISAEKPALFARIDAMPVPPVDMLDKIGTMASRNLLLLAAALSGVRVAASRIAAVKRVRDNLDTYDSDGHRATIPQLRPVFERKA